jgi:hypothetical protein
MYPPVEVINPANELLTIERTRIQRNNRYWSLMRRQAGVRKNVEVPREILEQYGEWAGKKYNLMPDDWANTLEKRAVKKMEDAVKDSVYAPFIDARAGIAAKSFGRVWAIVGDPCSYMDPRSKEQMKRSIGQLFQYCGVGDPNNKRRAGVKLQSNPKAGPRIHVIAENAGVKVKGAYYRSVYDEAKADALGRLHSSPCAPCGSKSAEQKAAQKEADEAFGGVVTLKNDVPAGEGVPWRLGHIHGHALRQVKREFLRDLYGFSIDL